MVWVGLAVVLGSVRRWSESPGVGSHMDSCPKRQGAQVIQGGAPALSLTGVGLRLSMSSSLNGVKDIVGVTDPMVSRRTPRRKVVPSLLPRLGALGSWAVRAIAGGVATASSHW